ncbi:MAG: hypothetical protein P4L51_10005 [Puia sp.]|nr:hypothetical protein [Puia sp.]
MSEFDGGYYAGYEEGKRQAGSDKRSAGNFATILALFIRGVVFIFLFLPALTGAYFVMHLLRYRTGHLTMWAYLAIIAGLSYLIECLFFGLKGCFIALRKKGSKWRFVFWGICFLYSFALPTLLFHVMIFELFKPPHGHAVDTANRVGWIGGALTGWVIFRRYRLHLDEAPGPVYWAYYIGRRIPR